MTDALGLATAREIRAQPEDWARLLAQLPGLGNPFLGRSGMSIIGCGSQFYLSLAAAWACRDLLGLPAEAVPASEFVAYPRLHRPPGEAPLAVLVSRSGMTTEVVEACRQASAMGVETLFLGAVEDAPLAAMATRSVVFPFLHEESVCTTRSTSGFLLALLWWAVNTSPEGGGAEPMRSLPDAGRRLLGEAERTATEAAGAFIPRVVAFLGSGPLYGIAREGALKCNEMALVPTAAFHSLEYRHGPKALAAREVLVVGLVSRPEEQALLVEMGELGGRTLAIGEEGPGGGIDWSVPVEGELGLVGRLPLYLVAVQTLGLAFSRARGLDADRPRNLSRFVDLGEKGG